MQDANVRKLFLESIFFELNHAFFYNFLHNSYWLLLLHNIAGSDFFCCENYLVIKRLLCPTHITQ